MSLSFRPEYSLVTPVIPAVRGCSAGELGLALLRDGLLTVDSMAQATLAHDRGEDHFTRMVLATGAVTEGRLYACYARFLDQKLINFATDLPDTRLLDLLGAAFCLRHGVLPQRRLGALTVVATAFPELAENLRFDLERRLGPVVFALASANQIEAALLKARGAAAARAAETAVATDESCRVFQAARIRSFAIKAAILCAGALWFAPVAVGLALTALAVLAMLAGTALKLAAGLALVRTPPQAAATVIPLQAAQVVPVVSIMVALYKESDIAPRLVRRLGRLNYPADRLDVLLVVEEEDHQTRDALAKVFLPKWMRVVVVPDGMVKTKPRALNYAFDHCRGSIVGVYDAEDAPEPDQILKVAARFAQSGPDLACLQGVLDFYNPRTNWLSRCFTIEYAVWFRLFLPGIARLGLAVPLGGTTLFFRRDALERLGRWDAHNVTEDADLGMRLARHGYRTELIATVTEEEANCRAFPWVKQRSRWIKGFMMTWASHMRSPVTLYRQLGLKQFVGFQVLLLGSILQQLLAPLLWTFWLVPFGFAHPLAAAMPDAAYITMLVAFFFAESVALFCGVAALKKTRHGLSWLWVPTLYFYHPMASLAAYKGVAEMLTRPFYWDKTSHGLFDGKT